MAQQRIFRLPLYQPTLPPVAIILVLIGWLVLTVGVIFLTELSPLLGVIGLFGIAVLVFLFLQPRWALPLYILVAVPGAYYPLSSSGKVSGLYVGGLMLVLIILMGFVQILRHQRTSRHPLLPASLALPLGALILVGLASILYSRIQPDPRVVYFYDPYNLVSQTSINIKEMVELLAFPIILIVSSKLVRTLGDATWVVRAYTGLGLVYALGTIFAAPLHLYSNATILGFRRPEVFGANSTSLGLLLVLFTTVVLGQALYARTRAARYYWWALALIFGLAVIMTVTREAWITLFFSVIVMLAVRFKHVAVLLLIPVLLLPLLIPGASDFFDPSKVYGFDRLIIWQDAISLWLNHPYFGIGAGNFASFDFVYGLEPIITAHNQYLEVLAEMGVQGLLCLLWGLLAIGWLTFKRLQAATTSQGKALALSYIGYYTTIVVGGFFISTLLPSASTAGITGALVLDSFHWVLFGVVLAMPQWEESRQVAAESLQPVTNQAQAIGVRSAL